jgi:hypothetical protein
LKPAQANNSLDPISKEKKTNAKKCWWSVQEVEGLPSKSEALSSNPSTKKKIFFFGMTLELQKSCKEKIEAPCTPLISTFKNGFVIFFFSVLGLEFQANTLSHSTSPFS